VPKDVGPLHDLPVACHGRPVNRDGTGLAARLTSALQNDFACPLRAPGRK
jgi:hypothetical protein